MIMKKIVLFAAASAACLFLAGCEEEKPKVEVTPATLTYFSFTSENNPDVLTTDLTVANPSSGVIDFLFPIGTTDEEFKSLVPSFETSDEMATVLIDGVEFISGTPHDFSKEVDLYVSVEGVNTLYTISVKARTISMSIKGESADSTTVNPFLAVNPVDGKAYIASNLTDVDGYYPLAYRLGNGLEPVAGKSHIFREARAANVSLGFDDEGNVYTAFNDYSRGTKTSVIGVSVAKLSDSFSYVGDTAALARTSNIPAIIPVSASDIWVGYPAAAATGNIGKRCLELAHWTGDWQKDLAISSTRPSDAYAYTCKTIYANGDKYLFIYNQNHHNVSMYKLQDQNWETVFESMAIKKADGTEITSLNLRNIDCDVASNGDVYILVGAQFETDAYIAGLVKYTPSTGEQIIVGGVMPSRDSNSDHTENWSMALDQFDVPYFVYTDQVNNYTTYLTYIDNKTKTWATPVTLCTFQSENPTIRFNDNGEAFISVRNKDNGHIVVFSSAE